MSSPYDQAVQDILAAGARLDTRGLAPATSGNYSVRLNDNRIAITVSGRHKGRLNSNDIMTIDMHGKPLEDKKPSAETLLHTQIYSLYPDANSILHIHSVPGAVLTRLIAANDITLEGYEMLKAFPGIKTHETIIKVPVFENSQDMNVLSMNVEKRLKDSSAPVYLIRDHGFYAWGKDMEEAERIAEAFEYLLSCEVEYIKARGKQ